MIRWCFAIFSVVLVGCSSDYPMDKPGTWSVGPLGSNDANLRTMVVRPRDLVRGTGERTSLGREATGPVNRLFAGKRQPLPIENASSIYSSSSTAPAGGDNVSGQ
jgi:hypothetical protein